MSQMLVLSFEVSDPDAIEIAEMALESPPSLRGIALYVLPSKDYVLLKCIVCSLKQLDRNHLFLLLQNLFIESADIVYNSTDADRVAGIPLISLDDGLRHRDIYRSVTRNFGETWKCEPITVNSTDDNMRSIVPEWKDPRTALAWMRGAYHSHGAKWTTAIVATILPPDPIH